MANQLPLFGDQQPARSPDLGPQNEPVLVCWWRRCLLIKRPRSGDCGECSQVTEMWAAAVRPHHRVVNGRG